MERNNIVAVFCMTFNQAAFIRQTIEGFLMQQTNFPFIVVLHDDASTDGTIEIIKEYQTKYPDIIKPIFEESNLYSKVGYQGVFKVIVPQLNAKYVAICDGDDYWIDPLKLQKQVDFLESHPDYSMCFHKALEHYEDGNIEDRTFADVEDRDYNGVEINDNWICASSSVVLRRSVFDCLLMQKWYENRKLINEDTPTFLSAATCGKIRGMSDTMNVYRKQPDGLSYAGITYEKMYKWGIYEYEIYKVFGDEHKESATQKAVTTLAEKCFIDGLSKGRFYPKALLKSFQFAPLLTLKTLLLHYSQAIKKRIR